MFETNLLNTVINETATLSVRKDKQHYRLDLYVSKKKLYDLDLNNLLSKVANEVPSLRGKDCKFLYNAKTNKYYLHNKNAIKVLELLQLETNVPVVYHSDSFSHKVNTVLNNKELFIRSKGKRLTEQELTKLEELRLSV